MRASALCLAVLAAVLTAVSPASAQTQALGVEATYTTNTPVTHTAFQVNNDGAFVARGTARDVGNATGCAPFLPAAGAGTRFMWLPCRGSVRFGRVPTGQTNWDDTNMNDFTFAGGNQVTASGYGAFAYGDQVTVSSTVGVGFGSAVLVSGTAGFSSGASNRCSGFACTAIGYTAKAGGQGSVAIGYRVTANNDYTVSLGYRASNNTHTGTFVWGDESTTDSVRAQNDNEFRIRAAGGIRLRTSSTSNSAPGTSGNTGCDLAAGSGTFTCSSSRLIKSDFMDVDGEDVLARLRAMPITSWTYNAEGNGVRHLGPVAEDFWDAFHLGVGETSVGAQDMTAVGLVGVQALAGAADVLKARVETLETENAALRSERESLERRLARLEVLVIGDPK